ncbi:hypothetical protein [Streptomyces anthocyanicus]|uniref:hypothetical protein n=1 Tax=Streptomyces anthocyanicus TaxID=68174 RepID=UPI00381B96D6
MFRLWKLGRKRPAQAPESTEGAVAPNEVSEAASADVVRTGQDNGLRNAIARGAAEGSAREMLREAFNKLFED